MELAREKAKKVLGAIKILAMVRVATLIGFPFWIDIGSAVSRDLGVSEEKLRELNEYEKSYLVSPEEEAVLRFADAMTAVPVDVPDEIFSQIRNFYDDSQIVELTSAIAWENYRAPFWPRVKGRISRLFRRGILSIAD